MKPSKSIGVQSAKTRKPHKKTRGGCFSCKARHIKCDQRKPECLNCERYVAVCKYPQPKSDYLASQSDSLESVQGEPETEATINHRIISLDQVQVEDQNATLNISQLHLLHHYTTATAKTLSAEPLNADVYSSYLVKVAFGYPFLLHAVLALGALHLSRTESCSEKATLLHLADHHHNSSITSFRLEIVDVNESNYEAVFLFSSTLFPYLWGCMTENDTGPDHTFDSITSNLLMTRRIRPLVHDFYERLSESELGRLRPQDTRIVDWDNLVLPTTTELTELQKFAGLVHHFFDECAAEACNQAIRVLVVVFDVAAQSRESPSDALLKMWIHFVSPRFMQLLSERQPGALIILAHYAVLLNRAAHYWFLAGVPTKILTAVYALIPAEWKPWMDWPRAQIEMTYLVG
ncbi:hypothetical protein IQ07DRAFT_643247 [Pyrenochaeta sp. DS3sAY3a]|nr:hypothetical protein IQ07DRAFT_643247 [Pyrenochaeta sp. DS3sAY3a]